MIDVANKDIECFSIKSIKIKCPNDNSLICGDLNVTLLVSGLDSAKFDEDREYSVKELVDIIRTCEGSIGIGAPWSYHNLH